ncbi:YihY/virulence factor BrkB family protein [Nocardioides sp. T2.26MG-1]|uniref:YihY/virulence factor BrkB family protein n=1 Tax=Nocardioides sp. T2.26MG-1 TaxID=3041166 RepID=UPI0024776D0D|nr:YihY/virulence factor BrkB family protein [Nocardioides sp. T2.26MG-1]CAI9405475.1 Inner membrane protein YhjD [Nocardioides sp. T2.26MG-1]
MSSLGGGIGGRVTALRRRRPLVDHLVRMQEHYGKVLAGQQAGAMTYFAFLSFFPILALAFFVVGLVSQVYDGADADLRRAINSILPGIVGSGEGKLSLDDIRTFSGWAGLLGLAGVLYSGLSWVSALRDALVVVFEIPAREQPGFVGGKLRDLVTLASLGVVLLVAVAVTGFVSGFSGEVVGWFGLGTELGWIATLVTVALGLAANALLFYLLFRLPADPHTPRRSLWRGAVLGALGFEALKQVSKYLLESTKEQPAFQAFGIALILLVWINYFSRVVLYAAAFAHTSREARAARVTEDAPPVQGPPSPPVARPEPASRPAWLPPYVAGAVSTLGVVAVARRLSRRRRAGATDTQPNASRRRLKA